MNETAPADRWRTPVGALVHLQRSASAPPALRQRSDCAPTALSCLFHQLDLRKDNNMYISVINYREYMEIC